MYEVHVKAWSPKIKKQGGHSPEQYMLLIIIFLLSCTFYECRRKDQCDQRYTHDYFFLKQDFWRELLPLRFQLESVAKILNTGKQSKAVTLRTEAKCIIWRLGEKQPS